MPVTVISTTHKPPGTTWFGQSSPENNAVSLLIREWVDSLPGLVSRGGDFIDEDTHRQTMIFDTIENYANYISQRADNPHFQQRKDYNQSTGIYIETDDTIT
jgi:hypothetical protein